MKKVAVVLSGCGVRDGSEIQEAVLSLLAIRQLGAEYVCFAPDTYQPFTVDHASGKQVAEKRSVLSEAGRIARGKILPLSELNPKAFDAIFLPGGFGVAINLSDYGEKNVDCTVNPDLKKIILEFAALKKPIGASCLAPIVLAKIFQGKEKVRITLGTDQTSFDELQSLGMLPEKCSPQEMISDDKAKVYTTPAYMEKADIAQIYEGINKVIKKIVS